MYNVSKSWDNANKQRLSPEGFVELSCYIPQLNETLVYTKSDLLSFKHEQTGSLISGELPKNHIDFSLDNSDGKWDPNNPRGLEKYLSERLKITVRYGFDINGVVEWIPGGVFYLSEWSTTSGGLDASFKARDVLEYMIDKTYTGYADDTLYELAEDAIAKADLPSDARVEISDVLKNYPAYAPLEDDNTVVMTPIKDKSVAEILQMCANAARCVLYQDRQGVLRIERLNHVDTGFTVSLGFSYTYPKVQLSRPLKDVEVNYGEDSKVTYQCSSDGETQTVNNSFVQTEDQAFYIGEWVGRSLQGRLKVEGDFRGDPRFDLFDVVSVENKYGTIAGVVLTDITYVFTGVFYAEYSGQVLGAASSAIYCGEIFTGEVS